MSLHLSTALMETLAEGVILIRKDGQMTDHNRAARPWLKRCLGSAAALAEIIQKTTKSGVQAPVRVDSIFEASGHTSEFYLCENGTYGFAIFIAKTAPAPSPLAPPPPHESEGFFSLLGEDFRHELTQLRLQLEKPAPETAEDIAQAQLQSLRLSRHLIAMEQLCELHQANAFFSGERVSLQDIINDAIGELSARRGDFSINQVLSGKPDQQGMLFGHAHWLKVAVKGLLESIGESSPAHCRIEIRVRQNGGFVVMTGSFSHYFHPRSTLPKPPLMRSQALWVSADIRLAICQRIVELHGGQLKIVAMDPTQADIHLRGVESFTLILPTNVPPQGRGQAACAGCIFPRQAEMYAQDLAFLVPRPPAGNAISNDELDFLAQVTAHPGPPPPPQP